MRRSLVVVLVALVILASAAPPAHAGHHAVGAGVVGLAAFALFAPLIIVGEVLAHAPVYSPAPAYNAPPPAYSRQTYLASAPAQSRVIQYPHGRYELRGDGVSSAYQWVWVPGAAAIPPVPPPPPSP
jgi:hypothetical protein